MTNAIDKWRQVRLKVWGPNACFTRPEMKVERVSYDLMTPSAARGVLEAILWKPAIRWIVKEIHLLAPVRFDSVRRNEVGNVFSGKEGFFIEDNRQQRAGLILREPSYLIEAEFEMTEAAGSGDSVQKFSEMFRRRARKGQCYHRPYLGCREFAADFELVDYDQESPEPIDETRDLSWMFFDFDYRDDRRALFYRAELNRGRMVIPRPESKEVVS